MSLSYIYTVHTAPLANSLLKSRSSAKWWSKQTFIPVLFWFFCSVSNAAARKQGMQSNNFSMTSQQHEEMTTVAYFANHTLFPGNTSGVSETEAETNSSQVFLWLLIILSATITVVGNIMVISSVMIFRRLQTIPNMFIVSLATADLIMGLFVLPIGAHYVVGKSWRLGKFVCDIWTSVDVLSVTASIETLCVISLDRFVAITMPFRYSLKMTRPRARFLIGLIWIISAAIAFVPIHLNWWKRSDKEAIECYNDSNCCLFLTNKTYAIVSSCLSFYIPLVIMVVTYSIVFKIAIQKRSKIRNHEGVFRRASMPGSRNLLWSRGEYRAVFTMGIIMGTFVICWLPFFIINVLAVFCHDCVPSAVFFAFNWIGYSNSFFNPWIYCHSKEFRRAFKRILQCGLCRDGFQQTSRASLAVAYTPSSSMRSSMRNDSNLSQIAAFFQLARRGSRRRASRMSTSSNRSRRSPIVNAEKMSHPNGNNNLTLNGCSPRYRYSNSEVEKCTAAACFNSVGSESTSSQLLPPLTEREEEQKKEKSSDCSVDQQSETKFSDQVNGTSSCSDTSSQRDDPVDRKDMVRTGSRDTKVNQTNEQMKVRCANLVWTKV